MREDTQIITTVKPQGNHRAYRYDHLKSCAEVTGQTPGGISQGSNHRR